jgi:hypothetical protein
MEKLGKREKLEAEIAERIAQLNSLETIPTGIIPLEDYSDEQKIDFFNNFYKFALEHVKEVEEEGWVDEDTSQWFYEEGMTILNLKDTKALWKYYGSLT